jgi:hypothetical protein
LCLAGDLVNQAAQIELSVKLLVGSDERLYPGDGGMQIGGVAQALPQLDQAELPALFRLDPREELAAQASVELVNEGALLLPKTAGAGHRPTDPAGIDAAVEPVAGGIRGCRADVRAGRPVTAGKGFPAVCTRRLGHS